MISGRPTSAPQYTATREVTEGVNANENPYLSDALRTTEANQAGATGETTMSVMSACRLMGTNSPGGLTNCPMVMSKPEMFLAMVLTNAKREEARGLLLSVELQRAKIDMLLLDGSCRQLAAPPPEILQEIIDILENGQRQFSSSVYAVTVDKVRVERGSGRIAAHISSWMIEHREE